MKTLSTAKLQQAITKAVAKVRRQHPELSDTDATDAYRTYRDHFLRRDDDPPVSTVESLDDLLLAIWDVIVDRELGGKDAPDGPLEDFYAAAFTALLGEHAAQDAGQEPLAVPGTTPVAEATPAPVIEASGEADQATNHIEDEYSDTIEAIFRLKIVLDGSRPPVTRLVLVDNGVSQLQLHHIIQAAMGWRGTEQFQFYPGMRQDLPSSGEITLGDMFAEAGDHCGYEFDTWYHDLELIGRERPEGRRSYPVCIAGERACPPEDIGGVAAYNDMIEILNQPDHPDYEEMAGWLTQDFHPDAFNIDQANLRLSRDQSTEFKAVV
ncbi:pRiA4b ORF-3-like protein [Neolewinella xylanilytica]|uniref:PRiA4b ORF-3-like protein n=1 Tax=Neolewinella xylanilytica TaxID=1514080 RepID=A0A2S6I016_9BACT|nr:plasmid pRiA4b ORF-3 family protein [Neolewinella xylanilytica]PPK84118.1 pRiA4b ORF-3-like protein [Neolewinella xylanilytica]